MTRTNGLVPVKDLIGIAELLADILISCQPGSALAYRVIVDEVDHGLVCLDKAHYQIFLDQLPYRAKLVPASEQCPENWIYVDQYVTDLNGSWGDEALIWFGPSATTQSLTWSRQNGPDGQQYITIGRFRWPEPYR